ncbi:MAG TPA: hypothetical protein VM009_01425 [Terriglobales bacterium]|nr:hypothetical protein [Terriglobales bacterium]
MADTRSLDGKLKEAYIQAARNMGSDYERKRALNAVGADGTKMREPI